MWLLSTDRAELHYFARNFDVTGGGYAILSHTWTGDEQTLQDVRAIGERCRASSDTLNPRDDPELSPKVRECCIIAERYGYYWVWIDSCCIDKTSSSELSEAINSMFRWYKEAEVCFAYLADVPTNCKLREHGSAFQKSRWHTRGWTLQELIAPDFLIFLSSDWHELGNRADLAELLEEITEIPAGVLTGEDQPAEYSICFRMSWASSRKTTRVEDEAYCLMGLFRVSMPTNYGEGKQAFIRLQYEIMQRIPDMSLFAFGYGVNQDHNFTFHPTEMVNHKWRYLLADSPQEFNSAHVYTPHLPRNANQRYPPLLSDSELIAPFEGGVELPRVAMTSYGVKVRVPIYEADGITIAVILCQQNEQIVGLFLTRDNDGEDPKRPRYFTCCVYTKPDTGPARFGARLANLGDDLHNLTFNGQKVEASWRTIYVVPTISDLDTTNSTTPMLTINCKPASPFRVPRWLVARFTALQFTFGQVRDTEMLQVLGIFLDGVVVIYVSFGSCTQHEDGSPAESLQLWAKVDVSLDYIQMNTFTHNCFKDHINSKSWATRSKFFGDVDRGVQLSLIPSTQMSGSSESFVIHLELRGQAFGEMFKRPGGVSMFPSLTDLKLERDTLRPIPKDPGSLSQSCISRSQTKPASSSTPPVTVTHSGTHASASSSLHSSVSSLAHPPTTSPSASSASISSSRTRASRIPRPVSKSPLDTHARASPRGRGDGRHRPEQGRDSRLRQAQGELRLRTPSLQPPTGPHRQSGTPGERKTTKSGPSLRVDSQGIVTDSDHRGNSVKGKKIGGTSKRS